MAETYPDHITLSQVIPLLTPLTAKAIKWIMANDNHSEAEALEFAWDRTNEWPDHYMSEFTQEQRDLQRIADGFGSWAQGYEEMLVEGGYTVPWRNTKKVR